MKKVISAVKAKIAAIENSQAGWTTMEYVVGAIALVGVISTVVGIFGQKLIQAINALQIG